LLSKKFKENVNNLQKYKRMKLYKFKINGNKYSVEISDIEENIVHVEVNGTPYDIEMETPISTQKAAAKPAAKVVTPSIPKAAPAPPPPVSIPQAQTAKSGGSIIKSPLPGVVLDIFVRVGDTVKAGQHIILLEAMKMENNIDADKEGTIKEIRVQRNDAVMEGDILIVIE
jgi:biotin carboxyl carrier protein